MAQCVVARRVHFNAAHRLHNPAHSAEWNRETFGPCNNPNYHGHNYELDIMVEGEIDPDTGYVVDVAVLKQLAEQHILSGLDHKNLNLDVPWFRDRLPSAENIAVYCWEQLAPRIPAGRLARLRLWETPRNYVDYDGR
jgi:6-pyruvoyltetrahydropterin/6-carboxytetrahydropterin synthase